MKRINLIVKLTDFCNLRCKYCYNSCAEYKKQFLPLEDFEKMVRLLAKNYNEIIVIWHGGEPSTAGLDYYEQAMEIEKVINHELGVTFDNRMQSNGTLFNEKWVKFIKKHGLKVGISFDGIHNDQYRGGTKQTLRTMELFKKNGIKFSSIAVVVDGDYDLISNYEFFKEKNIPVEFSYMIPEGAGKNIQQMSAEQYAEAAIKLFDYWLYDLEGVSIRTFASHINLALGGNSLICNYSSCHGKFICINSEGNIFNCSRQSIHEYCFGNIREVETLEDCFRSDGFKALLKGSIARRNACKESCDLFERCQGGCADVAICEGAVDKPPEYSCLVFKKLYQHVQGKMTEIFASKTPLDTLNPWVRDAVIKCMGVREDYSFL